MRTGILILVLFAFIAPHSVRAQSTEELSKKERVQAMREALRERRQKLRTGEQEGLSVLGLITQRYEAAHQHLFSIGLRLEAQPNAASKRLHEAQFLLATSYETIIKMQRIAQRSEPASTDTLLQFTTYSASAKNDLKMVQDIYLSVVTQLKAQ